MEPVVRQHRRAPRGQRTRCTVAGCDKIAVGWGYCTKHYQRWQRLGDPEKLAGRRRVWTEANLIELERMLDAGYTYETIGRRLGVTATAVVMTCKQYKIARRQKRALTARGCAILLGCVDINGMAVERWIADGRLRATRGVKTRYRQWKIDQDALLDFLGNPDHWHVWIPDLIAEPFLREWAIEVRGGVRFLAIKEAAAKIGVRVDTLRYWTKIGHVPAYHDRKLTFIRESDLVGLQPPRRGAAPRPRPSIRTLERQGHAWQEIPAPAPFTRVRILRKAA